MELLQPDPANGVFILIVLSLLIISQVARFFRNKKAKAHATGSAAAFSAAGYAAPSAQPAQATDQAQPITATAAHWLAYVNHQPDTVPHVAIVGPSGAGKTTLARAILGQRPGQILVITAKEGDDWGGLPYVGIDDDASYTTAQATFEALDKEVKRRLVATKRQQPVGEWLTVVLDDYSTLRKVCPAADDPFMLVARLGRSLRVRLIVLSDTALVKSWGLEGEGETRNNFAFILVKRGHTATCTVDDVTYQLDTATVPQLARVVLAPRAWSVPQPLEIPVRRALVAADLDAIPVQNRFRDAAVPGSLMPHTSGTPEDTDATGSVPADDEAVMLRTLVEAGHSRNKIAAMLGGSKPTALARIRRALGEE